MSSRCWCMDWKRGVSQRLLLSDWMPLTRSRILDTLSTLLSGRLRLPSSIKYHENKKAPLIWPRSTFRFQARSSPSCQCVALTTKRLEETSRAPVYHLAEGDWCWCAAGKHQYPLSLEEGQRSCSLATYHQHGNTPIGARHWRRYQSTNILNAPRTRCIV